MLINKEEEVLALLKENNKMLHQLRRHQWWASVMRAVYWIIIIAVSLGTYYLVQPYIEMIIDTYTKISGTADQVSSFNFKSFFGN